MNGLCLTDPEHVRKIRNRFPWRSDPQEYLVVRRMPRRGWSRGSEQMVNGVQPTAVVTGAGGSIGRATALRIQREGHTVLAVDREGDGLASLADCGMAILKADLSTTEGISSVVDAAGRPQLLVNAAGILWPKPLMDVTVHDLRTVFAVNFEAVWALTSHIGREMPSGGAIVNVSSGSAKLATTLEVAAYAASKSAVLSLTRSFAYAFAPAGVRVNAICPGLIDTPMQDTLLAAVAVERGSTVEELSRERNARIPLGRPASSDECAAGIWFLLSDEASYMTGQAVNFTGGMITW